MSDEKKGSEFAAPVSNQETETAILRERGDGWSDYASWKIQRVESRLSGKVFPGQDHEMAAFTGGLVEFLIAKNAIDINYESENKVIDDVMRLFGAFSAQHNYSAWMAQAGIALADNDRLDAAEKLAEPDGPVVEEYQDQVLLAIAASYARRGEKLKALEYMTHACCAGYHSVNDTNSDAFNRVFQSIINYDMSVHNSKDIM